MYLSKINYNKKASTSACGNKDVNLLRCKYISKPKLWISFHRWRGLYIRSEFHRRLTQSGFFPFRFGNESRDEALLVLDLPEYNYERKLSKWKTFGNKHLVTFTHPSVLVYYSLINKTKSCLSLWLPEGSWPRGNMHSTVGWEETAEWWSFHF